MRSTRCTSEPALALVKHIEHWKIDRLIPFVGNARTHSDAQIAQIAASIREFGFVNPILVDTEAGIIAGHGRLLAARKLGLREVPVIVLDHLTPAQRRAYVLVDNKLAENAGWDEVMLQLELAILRDADFDLNLLGFDDEDLRRLLAEADGNDEVTAECDEVGDPPSEPTTRSGDIWQIGPHRLICGDCRNAETLEFLFEGGKANVAITSPPDAKQREYDASSGFKPIAPERYVEWFHAVARNVASILASDGSSFLNIKEHASDGERSLHVKDLVLAHKRQWGWRFVDEFCWRNTANGVPGHWGDRFKNAWEPVFHFSRQPEIKFRPLAAGIQSADGFDYSPSNPKSTSGSGLLGTGPRGSGKGDHRATDDNGRFAGIARPSNVIEVKSESGQGEHAAPFPRALVEFFVKSFSDTGDIVFDPFMGSGTTMAAAHVLGRVGYGVEISPAYCDVILRRIAQLMDTEPVLAETGTTMGEVTIQRGIGEER